MKVVDCAAIRREAKDFKFLVGIELKARGGVLGLITGILDAFT